MNVVDSWAWLEYFADTPQAGFFAKPIEDVDSLLVPTVALYEVTKVVRQQRGAQSAHEAAALMMQGNVVELTAELALLAASYSLPLADGLIYATAQKHDALLWTQDDHFRGLPGVKFRAKPR